LRDYAHELRRRENEYTLKNKIEVPKGGIERVQFNIPDDIEWNFTRLTKSRRCPLQFKNCYCRRCVAREIKIIEVVPSDYTSHHSVSLGDDFERIYLSKSTAPENCQASYTMTEVSE
jgi:hypothetical protein